MHACSMTGVFVGCVLFAMSVFTACGSSQPAEPQNPEPAGETAPEPAAAPTEPAASSEDGWEGEAQATAGAAPAPSGDAETRTTAVIQETILNNRKPFRDCYDKARKELPDLKGTLTLTFKLDPEGKVKEASLNQERSDIKSPLVVDCAIAELKKIQFPPSSRAMESTVNYPFNFKP